MRVKLRVQLEGFCFNLTSDDATQTKMVDAGVMRSGSFQSTLKEGPLGFPDRNGMREDGKT